MVMISELLRFRVTDAQGGNARLIDLILGKLDTDYPLVTQLVCSAPNRRGENVLPWKAVTEIDKVGRQIKIEDLAHAKKVDNQKQVVRLGRDVLDALILDLQHRQTTRANDLWLEEEKESLKLTAADVGGRAILRRLLRGHFDEEDRPSLCDWRYVEFLRGDPQAVSAGALYHSRIVRLPAGEIAHLTANIPYLHAAELVALLPKQLAADVMEVISPERQLQVFEELEEGFALQVLGHMEPNLAADIVGNLDVKMAQKYLNALPKATGKRILDLLKYPPNTVGSIMTNEVVTVASDLKIKEARTALREKLKRPDFVYFVYVVEKEAPYRLRGVLSLRQFLTAEDDQTVEEIMNPYLLALSPFDSSTEAGYRLLNSQLAALPVVGKEGQLLGTVTIDAAVSQVAPRGWRAQAPKVFS